MSDRSKAANPSILMIAYTDYESDPRVIRAAEAALEANFSVDVLSLRRHGQQSAQLIRGVRVLRVRQRRYRGSSHLRYLLNYLEFFTRCFVRGTYLFSKNRYSVVHVHNMPDFLIFSAIIPKIRGAKLILDIHDPVPETFSSKFKSLESRWVYKLLLYVEKASVAFSDVFMTVHDPVKHGVLIKHGYKPDRIRVVANFADDRLFRLVSYPPLDGRISCVFHGTILERYGLRTLIDALSLMQKPERLKVTIIGDGDFSSKLKELIASKDLNELVEFRHRVYPLCEIPQILSRFHVGLVPLDMSSIGQYALPLKLIEYACMGIPCISVRNAAIEHYFRPDECIFFDSGDSQTLARLLDEIVEHPRGLLEYREKLKIARERLLWSTEKEKYVGILRELTDFREEPVWDRDASQAEKIRAPGAGSGGGRLDR